jgi:hypothetical protein
MTRVNSNARRQKVDQIVQDILADIAPKGKGGYSQPERGQGPLPAVCLRYLHSQPAWQR